MRRDAVKKKKYAGLNPLETILVFCVGGKNPLYSFRVIVVVVTGKYIVRERNVVIVCVTVCKKYNVLKL